MIASWGIEQVAGVFARGMFRIALMSCMCTLNIACGYVFYTTENAKAHGASGESEVAQYAMSATTNLETRGCRW